MNELDLAESRPAPRVARHPKGGFNARVGMQVRITGGRFEGQEGEITFRYPSHVYVRLPEHPFDVLVLLKNLADVELLAEEEALAGNGDEEAVDEAEITCGICAHVGISVKACEDGVRRCKLCRQRAEFGRTFYVDDDEVDAEKNGARRPILPLDDDVVIQPVPAGKPGIDVDELTNSRAWQPGPK